MMPAHRPAAGMYNTQQRIRYLCVYVVYGISTDMIDVIRPMVSHLAVECVFATQICS